MLNISFPKTIVTGVPEKTLISEVFSVSGCGDKGSERGQRLGTGTADSG